MVQLDCGLRARRRLHGLHNVDDVSDGLSKSRELSKRMCEIIPTSTKQRCYRPMQLIGALRPSVEGPLRKQLNGDLPDLLFFAVSADLIVGTHVDLDHSEAREPLVPLADRLIDHKSRH